MGRTDFGMPFLVETPDVRTCAALCAKLGLDFVEINMSFPQCGVTVLDAGTLRALQEEFQIYFTFHIDETLDVCAFNPYAREAYRRTMREALELAVKVGVPTINMHLERGVYVTLPTGKVYLYNVHRDRFFENIRSFRSMCEEVIGASPVRICVENTQGFMPHEREAVELLLQSPVFGLTLDIGHCHAANNMDIDFYDRHADRLFHMHAHDTKGKQDHMAFGDGEIDLSERLNRARGNKARVVLETKTVAALQKSIPQLQEFGGVY